MDSAERMVASVGALVRCESPTEDLIACEQVCGVAVEEMGQWLTEPAHLGVHQGRPYVRWGAEHPEVLLLGHLDTVWPVGTLERLPWRVEGDTMRGPGVFDMKTGVVQGWAALASVGEQSSRVGMLLTTDEETGSATSRPLIDDAIRNARAVLVLEPALGSSVKIARKGTSWYVLTFRGRAAHAGLDPERGVNAAVEAALLTIACRAWADPELGTTVTPTLLAAGTTSNTVPAEASLTIDVRAWTAGEQQRVDRLVREWTLEHPEADWTIAGGIDRPALEKSMSADLFARAVGAAETLGLPILEGAAVGGASDGNLTAAAGVPTLDGLGAIGDGAHADHEHASVTGMTQRAALIAALISDVLADGDG
ncbi:MAG: M20 family metallopeptidase [Actinobacteria bacterium]|nr:M20 family metallopeptidase [Actinomycetota bacterium]